MNNPNAFLHDFIFNHTDPKIPYCPLSRWMYYPSYPIRLWDKEKIDLNKARESELRLAQVFDES